MNITKRACTVIYPKTRAHDLMNRLRYPDKVENIEDVYAVQFLRLLKWNVIYFSTVDGYVWLNQPVGDDALRRLNISLSATVRK